MIPQVQLRDFQVRLNNGQSINEPINNIRELDDLIRIYGRGIIGTITFYFYDNNHPYHTLILRNTEHNNNTFVVEFYHYYDQYLQKVELSTNQKMIDYRTVRNYLNNNQNLVSGLVRYIIDPFHIANNTTS
jgi:hypothetical protein